MGGKPTPYTVQQFGYAGAMGGPECPTHHNQPVCQGVGAETELAGGGGDVGNNGKGVPGLRTATELGNVIEIPELDHDGLG